MYSLFYSRSDQLRSSAKQGFFSKSPESFESGPVVTYVYIMLEIQKANTSMHARRKSTEGSRQHERAELKKFTAAGQQRLRSKMPGADIMPSDCREPISNQVLKSMSHLEIQKKQAATYQHT